jgi:hypothetical protein
MVGLNAGGALIIIDNYNYRAKEMPVKTVMEGDNQEILFLVSSLIQQVKAAACWYSAIPIATLPFLFIISLKMAIFRSVAGMCLGLVFVMLSYLLMLPIFLLRTANIRPLKGGCVRND